jgi:hypothetical protein
MIHNRASYSIEDLTLLPAYRRLLLNKAHDISCNAFQRLQELHRRFPFHQNVLTAFQKAGVELPAGEGPGEREDTLADTGW